MRRTRISSATAGGLFFLNCSLVILAQPAASAAISDNNATSVAKAPMSADQVVRKLEQRNAQRAAALAEVDAIRTYRVHYVGFLGTRDAEVVAKVTYRAPNSKQFQIISQNGSKFVVDHVLRRLMDTEREAADDEDQRAMALTTENYQFTLAGYELTKDGAQYVLELHPRSQNRFLCHGKIWVDANDFAVVRMQGEPSHNPSLWIRKTEIEHRYVKVGDFWLPIENHTESLIRMGGHATLSIEYKDYKVTKLPGVANLQASPASSK
jgi:outer membrane lipoprotein-sorting protein